MLDAVLELLAFFLEPFDWFSPQEQPRERRSVAVSADGSRVEVEAEVAVRPRRSGDLPVLLALLQRTHEQQGYPVRAAAVGAWWLAPADELGGWVALAGERVVGHVALHPADSDAQALPAWRAATGRGPAGLAVVSRLISDGTVRGAGTALLRHAVKQARELGREPVLQVDPDSSARGFYLRHGWREAGVARQQWGHRTVDAVLMVLAG